MPTTDPRLRDTLALVYSSRGEGLVDHLQQTYGIDVIETAQLDAGVFHIHRGDGPDWVARVFLPQRGMDRVAGDASILKSLANEGIPAERTAHADAVSLLGDCPVLVTEFVPGKPPGSAKWVLQSIGDSLGRLHAMDVPAGLRREGGSLHHVPGFEGLPGEDLRLAGALLDDIEAEVPEKARAGVTRLRQAVEDADDCADLPRALVHSDPAAVNLLATADKQVVLIDWAGSGIGPRIACFAQVLGFTWSRRAWDASRLQTLVNAYTRYVNPTDDEIRRIPDAMGMRPLWLAAWNCWTRVLRDKPLNGDEWWLKRALAPHDPRLGEMLYSAFRDSGEA